MSFAWHVATVHPFSELIAEQQLRLKGLQPFNPKCKVTRITRGQKVVTEKSYIPGYIFINFDNEDVLWRFINTTRGVRRLLTVNPETPVRIREAAMSALLAKCSGDIVDIEEADAALAKFIPVGAMVRVAEGPFEGVMGKVHWTHGDRVRVLISLFGRASPVQFKSEILALV